MRNGLMAVNFVNLQQLHKILENQKEKFLVGLILKVVRVIL